MASLLGAQNGGPLLFPTSSRDPAISGFKRKRSSDIRQEESKLVHFNIPQRLQDSWLENIHKKLSHKSHQVKTSFSAFDPEQKLLEGLFATKTRDPAAAKQTILNFCTRLRALTNIELQKNISNATLTDFLIDETKQKIAKVIFLADTDLVKTASLIDLTEMIGSGKRIEIQFNASLQMKIEAIALKKEQHEKISIQNPEMAVSILKPILIAEILVTTSGLINLGLIDSIKKQFFNVESLLHYEKELLQTLDDIEHSLTLRNNIESVKKPISPELPSNDLIRISLGLPGSAEVTDRQAKIVILASLLSDMRQGDVGSCFGTCVAILMKGSLKNKVVSDLKQIIREGVLTRAQGDGQSDFVPVFDISDSALHKTIKITHDGHVKEGGELGYLWESPGIIAACRQLNIPENRIKNAILPILEYDFETHHVKPKGSVNLTPYELITRLVKFFNFSDNASNADIQDQTNLATFAFSSETNTSLLRTWESCVAAMAESNSSDDVRSKILSCVSKAFDPIYPKDRRNKLNSEASKVNNLFQKVLNDSIQLRYDPQVEVQTKSRGDGHSTTLGAFILHELDQGTRSISATMVETPVEFKRFIAKRLDITSEQLQKDPRFTGSERTTKISLKIIKQLKDHLAKPDSEKKSFLAEVIRFYDEGNQSIKNPLKSWETIERLPFRDATGDENLAVYIKATGITPNAPDKVRPKDAEALLEAFIRFGRKRAQKDAFLADDDPYQRYMVNTPEHAFTLTPEDLSIVGAISSSASPKTWIHDHMIKPGVAVANTPLSPKQKEVLIAEVCKEMVPAEKRASFKKAMGGIDPSKNSLHLYSSALLEILLKVTKRKNKKTRVALSKDLTNLILSRVLTPNAKQQLSKTAARIADTNWVGTGVKHIYFACFFDPLTAKLQLGTQDEDSPELQAVDQDEWVAYIPWEMYGVKLRPEAEEKSAVKMDATT